MNLTVSQVQPKEKTQFMNSHIFLNKNRNLAIQAIFTERLNKQTGL